MEDNKTPEAPSAPTPCTAGCGFYGNQIYNNMCSKCFKEQQGNQQQVLDVIAPPVVEPPVIKKEIIIPEPVIQQPKVQEPVAPKEEDEGKIRQKNKGRCFKCRSKIPLAKQVANKCRCELVFCDTHRYPDKHECEFDHAKNDKDILAKKNPKLNEKPRGGNDFTRIA